MEQYWMPKKLDFKNLRYALNNYHAQGIFIRLKGSMGGHNKLNVNLEEKVLDFKKHKSGVDILIDGENKFHFPLTDYASPYNKGFSIAYERINPNGSIVILGWGEDPYDSNLPEPKSSIFRNVWDNHLLEIIFEGRIPLKFHSWWDEQSRWKYWTIDKSKKKK
jgi:hypothetical protein